MAEWKQDLRGRNNLHLEQLYLSWRKKSQEDQRQKPRFTRKTRTTEPTCSRPSLLHVSPSSFDTGSNASKSKQLPKLQNRFRGRGTSMSEDLSVLPRMFKTPQDYPVILLKLRQHRDLRVHSWSWIHFISWTFRTAVLGIPHQIWPMSWTTINCTLSWCACHLWLSLCTHSGLRGERFIV